MNPPPDDELKPLCQPLRDQFSVELLQGKRCGCPSVELSAQIFWLEHVLVEEEFLLDRFVFREVVRGDGQRGRDGERLPVHTRGDPCRPLLLPSGAPK